MRMLHELKEEVEEEVKKLRIIVFMGIEQLDVSLGGYLENNAKQSLLVVITWK